MEFINREKELQKIKNDYEQYIKTGQSQIYIITANSGIGKSEFIKKIAENLPKEPIEIIPIDTINDYSMFRRFVIELDKISYINKYPDFKEFYKKKINGSKALQLLLKISSFFGQAFIEKVSKENGLEDMPSGIDLPSLVPEYQKYDTFIFNAQTENLFEYAKYVLTHNNLCFIFPNASKIDPASLDLINKLIVESRGNIFILECTDEKAGQYFKNSHNVLFKTYQLDKLSDEHINLYINLLSAELGVQVEQVDFTILQDSIKKGDLSEISIILKDFSERLKGDKVAKLFNLQQIIDSISQSQLIFLILSQYANRKLQIADLIDIMSTTDSTFSQNNVDFLIEKNILEVVENFVFLTNPISELLQQDSKFIKEKFIAEALLIKALNLKFSETNRFDYLDTLVDYHISSKQFLQIKLLLPKIQERLLYFNSQQNRVEYFSKFLCNLQEIIDFDNTFSVEFAKLAYDTNLYREALEFINTSTEINEDTVFVKALILNRYEQFEKSNEYINSLIFHYSKHSSIFFKLSLVKIMNLVQLEQREDAKIIFEEIKLQSDNNYFPFLIRISNVFEPSFPKRLKIVEEISEDIYSISNSEYSALHAIYLAYLYTVNGQFTMSETSLNKSREFFGDKLTYNHMILHNEATIKFYSNELDESIPELLNNAKLTAYDTYDILAINNNLLVYYLKTDSITTMDCFRIVDELEDILNNTNFKRFIDKINYNLYHYYSKMYNSDKKELYKKKLIDKGIQNFEAYQMKLMFETSWKFPFSLYGE